MRRKSCWSGLPLPYAPQPACAHVRLLPGHWTYKNVCGVAPGIMVELVCARCCLRMYCRSGGLCAVISRAAAALVLRAATPTALYKIRPTKTGTHSLRVFVLPFSRTQDTTLDDLLREARIIGAVSHPLETLHVHLQHIVDRIALHQLRRAFACRLLGIPAISTCAAYAQVADRLISALPNLPAHDPASPFSIAPPPSTAPRPATPSLHRGSECVRRQAKAPYCVQIALLAKRARGPGWRGRGDRSGGKDVSHGPCALVCSRQARRVYAAVILAPLARAHLLEGSTGGLFETPAAVTRTRADLRPEAVGEGAWAAMQLRALRRELDMMLLQVQADGRVAGGERGEDGGCR